MREEASEESVDSAFQSKLSFGKQSHEKEYTSDERRGVTSGGYSRGRGRNQRGGGRSDYDRIEKLQPSQQHIRENVWSLSINTKPPDVSLLQTSQPRFALEKSLKLNPIDLTRSCKERGQWPICFNYLKEPLSFLYFMYHCLKGR